MMRGHTGITVTLPAESRELLRQIAKRQNVTVEALIERWVAEKLESALVVRPGRRGRG